MPNSNCLRKINNTQNVCLFILIYERTKFIVVLILLQIHKDMKILRIYVFFYKCISKFTFFRRLKKIYN